MKSSDRPQGAKMEFNVGRSQWGRNKAVFLRLSPELTAWLKWRSMKDRQSVSRVAEIALSQECAKDKAAYSLRDFSYPKPYPWEAEFLGAESLWVEVKGKPVEELKKGGEV